MFANRVATTSGEMAAREVVDVGGGIGEEEPVWDVGHRQVGADMGTHVRE